MIHSLGALNYTILPTTITTTTATTTSTTTTTTATNIRVYPVAILQRIVVQMLVEEAARTGKSMEDVAKDQYNRATAQPSVRSRSRFIERYTGEEKKGQSEGCRYEEGRAQTQFRKTLKSRTRGEQICGSHMKLRLQQCESMIAIGRD